MRSRLPSSPLKLRVQLTTFGYPHTIYADPLQGCIGDVAMPTNYGRDRRSLYDAEREIRESTGAKDLASCACPLFWPPIQWNFKPQIAIAIHNKYPPVLVMRKVLYDVWTKVSQQGFIYKIVNEYCYFEY